MKRIIALTFLLALNFCLFAQKTTSYKLVSEDVKLLKSTTDNSDNQSFFSDYSSGTLMLKIDDSGKSTISINGELKNSVFKFEKDRLLIYFVGSSSKNGSSQTSESYIDFDYISTAKGFMISRTDPLRSEKYTFQKAE